MLLYELMFISIDTISVTTKINKIYVSTLHGWLEVTYHYYSQNNVQ